MIPQDLRTNLAIKAEIQAVILPDVRPVQADHMIIVLPDRAVIRAAVLLDKAAIKAVIRAIARPVQADRLTIVLLVRVDIRAIVLLVRADIRAAVRSVRADHLRTVLPVREDHLTIVLLGRADIKAAVQQVKADFLRRDLLRADLADLVLKAHLADTRGIGLPDRADSDQDPRKAEDLPATVPVILLDRVQKTRILFGLKKITDMVRGVLRERVRAELAVQ